MPFNAVAAIEVASSPGSIAISGNYAGVVAIFRELCGGGRKRINLKSLL